MSLRVVQFSKTALAGAPIRIAQAVAIHTSVEVRHVDLSRWDVYDHDVVHDEDPERARALAEDADIIHLYNYLDLSSDAFAPIDFADLARRGKRFVRHFQSTPMRVARSMRQTTQDVLDDTLPKIVIAQYPERYFPTARVVPNIVPETDPLYMPVDGAPEWDVLHSPSNALHADEARWETKGLHETRCVFDRLERDHGIRCKQVTGIPLRELMPMKQRAAILIDELVSGSYHLSALEGLCVGRPVLAHIDAHTDRILRFMSGADVSPFVAARLEDAPEIIRWLVGHPAEREAIGRDSRRWIETYWSAKTTAGHIERVYTDLMEDPALITRQDELRLDTPTRRFFALDLHDAVYEARVNRRREHEARLPGPLGRVEAALIRVWRGLKRRISPRTAGRIRRVLGRDR